MVTQCVVKHRAASGASYAVVTAATLEHATQLYSIAHRWWSPVSQDIDVRGWRMCAMRWWEVDEEQLIQASLKGKGKGKGKGKTDYIAQFLQGTLAIQQAVAAGIAAERASAGEASSSGQPGYRTGQLGQPGHLSDPLPPTIEQIGTPRPSDVGSEHVTYTGSSDILGLPMPDLS